MENFEHHPIIIEFRQMIHKRMPDSILLLVYFNWDEGSHKTEISELNEKFSNIVDQLNKTTLQFVLKERLIELLPQMEDIYQKLIKDISEEEWSQFKEWKNHYGE